MCVVRGRACYAVLCVVRGSSGLRERPSSLAARSSAPRTAARWLPALEVCGSPTPLRDEKVPAATSCACCRWAAVDRIASRARAPSGLGGGPATAPSPRAFAAFAVSSRASIAVSSRQNTCSHAARCALGEGGPRTRSHGGTSDRRLLRGRAPAAPPAASPAAGVSAGRSWLLPGLSCCGSAAASHQP